jgi:hypothetical protein
MRFFLCFSMSDIRRGIIKLCFKRAICLLKVIFALTVVPNVSTNNSHLGEYSNGFYNTYMYCSWWRWFSDHFSSLLVATQNCTVGFPILVCPCTLDSG